MDLDRVTAGKVTSIMNKTHTIFHVCSRYLDTQNIISPKLNPLAAISDAVDKLLIREDD